MFKARSWPVGCIKNGSTRGWQDHLTSRCDTSWHLWLLIAASHLQWFLMFFSWLCLYLWQLLCLQTAGTFDSLERWRMLIYNTARLNSIVPDRIWQGRPPFTNIFSAVSLIFFLFTSKYVHSVEDAIVSETVSLFGEKRCICWRPEVKPNKQDLSFS